MADDQNLSAAPPPTNNNATEISSSSAAAANEDDDDLGLDSMFSDMDLDDDVPPLMGRTEKNSFAFLSTGNPCLDFFFKVVPGTPATDIAALLAAAWHHDAITALKLVCHLRGVRGAGKSDKEGFYAAALWLHANHPKTLALNAGVLAGFGYPKDLLEILYRLVVDAPDFRAAAETARTEFRFQRRRERRRRFATAKSKTEKAKEKQRRKEVPREERIAAELEKVKEEVEKASEESSKKKARLAGRAAERYDSDPDYRFLHDRTAELFAGMLASDMEELRAGRPEKIGLAAKWCPSLDSSFDRATLLCESIARRVFSSGEEHERVRDRLRREVLVPLRRALELPETFMSSRRWGELPYNRVASVAMKNYKKIFKDHDKGRFEEYLGRVKEGKAKIAAGALLPHEILSPAARGEHDEVAELQWERMVEDLKLKGKLNDCIAVCDVSGSMAGTPMEVCVALGLLVSELCEEPWKGRVITFSAYPQLHAIEGETLVEKAAFLKQMSFGMNTDLQKVFDKLLAVAVAGKLLPERMVKRVFVFSDMEFDRASANAWETDHQAIRRRFGEAGYGEAVPEVVFWNLRSSNSIPTSARQEGVALVSGFSKNTMKLFLEGGGVVDPVKVMEMAVSGDEYRKLAVFD